MELMNRDMHHVAEPGKFEIEIADSSMDVKLNGEFEGIE